MVARTAISILGAACALILGGRLPAADFKVAFNEIHYHPADDTRDGEFIEIHNYGEEVADLGRWFISGGVDFFFAPGAAIEPGGFLLVARNAAELAARHGLDPAAIAGEYSGSLSNGEDTLELWTAQNYLISYVEYSDTEPFPATPDGLGPSLERLSPWREEGDPQAWAASTVVGGTPGRRNSVRIEDPETSGPGDDIIPPGAVWRFFRGVSEPPAEWADNGFDASSWESGPAGFGYDDDDDATILSDMRNNYTTVYARREFAIADPAGVESLTFTVSYDDGYVAYLNGVEIGRGNAAGPPGSRLLHDDVASSFTTPAITDVGDISSSIDILVPGTNVLAVQGLNASLGSADFSLHPSLAGTLSDDGEPPPAPSPPAERDLVINEVAAGEAGSGWIELFNPTSRTVDASGRRLQLAPASRGDHSLAPGSLVPAGERLVLTEAELGFELDTVPAVILSTADGRFIDGLNPRTHAAGQSSGRFPDGADNRFVFDTPTRALSNALDLDERVVIHEIMYHPGDENSGGEYIEFFNRSDKTVDMSGWALTRGVDYVFPKGTVLGAGEFLVVARDPVALEARYGLSGVLGPYAGRLRNDAETILLRDANNNPVDRVRFADEDTWPEEADGGGPSVELIHPDLENRHGPAWAASAGEGTPGAPNSRRENDPAPIVVGVEHSPVVPAPSDTVRVLAVASDDDRITSVTLFHEVDGGGPSGQTPMVDDGIGDDGIAGNGVHGGDIPPRADGRIVAFWIRAEATGGQSTTAPEGAPDPAFLYQVESPTAEDVRPVYRIIMRQALLDNLQSRNRNSDVLLDLTFVAGDRAYYNRGIRYRGNSARSCNPLSYRVQFSHDHDLFGIKRLNLNGCNSWRQGIGLDYLTRIGMATPRSWYRRIALNGDREPELHLRVEAINNEFLERNYPGDDDGNLYRGEGRANLDYRGEDFDAYRGNYRKMTNQDADDYSDVVDLSRRFDPDLTSDEDFPAALEERVDIEQWAFFFAAWAVLGSTENAILLNNGDDYFLYRRFSDDRWILLPWDLDSVFDDANQVLFRPTVDAIERFLEHPRYAPDYWCHLEQILDSGFAPEIVNSRIDHLAPLFSAGRIQTLRSFVTQRRAYILERLNRSLQVQVDSGAILCDGTIHPNQSSVTLSGLAPGCLTTEVLINGTAVSYDPQSQEWGGSIDLRGEAQLVISTVYRGGLEIERRTMPVSDPAASTALPASVAGSITLARDDSPYRAGSDFTVESGATLTIEPGVTLLFDTDASLRVEGRLRAIGSEAEPIVMRRDVCGSSWEGIAFLPGSVGNELAHCVIADLTQAPGYPASIAVDGADVRFRSVSIESGAGTMVLVQAGGAAAFVESDLAAGENGIAFVDAAGSVERCRLTSWSSRAIFAAGSTITVADSLILDSREAISLADGAHGTLTHLTVHGCATGLLLAEETPGAGGAGADADSLIVWETGQAVDVDGSSSVDLTYSDTSGGVQPGEGNISADPAFVDAANGDFRLRGGSPCRGAGMDGTEMGALPYEPTGEPSRFLLCDGNGDGTVNIADPVSTLLVLFSGRPEGPCAAARDCDTDGGLGLADVIFSFNHQFRRGEPPRAPYPECDETTDFECLEGTCVR